MLWTLLVTAALAVPPSAVLTDSGAVVGTVSVTTAPTEMMRLLGDPTWVAGVGGAGTRVTVKSHEGSCLIADYVSPSSVMEVTYTVKQCPTTTGYVATMITSNAFHSYRTEWKVEAEGAGSRLTYRLELDSKLWVPESLVTSTTRRSVEKLMQRLAEKLGPA
jgi:ribosome-associated toxin RatA of RatAB toxin-antitoxin module